MSAKNKGKKHQKNTELESTSDEQPQDLLHDNVNQHSHTPTNNDSCKPLDNITDFATYLAGALKTQEVKSGFSDILKPLIQLEIQKMVVPLNKKMETISDKVDFLESDFEAKNEDLTGRIKLMETEFEQSKTNLLDLERKIKACNLKISGLDTPPASNLTERQSTFKEIFMKKIKEAEIKGVELSDLSSVHFGKGHDSKNFVILTMSNEQAKNILYFQRTKLKKLEGKIYINEDLTKEDSRIYRKTREEVKQKKLFSTWTHHGKVFGKLSEIGKPFHIDK
jgi:hypothetical protein